MAAIQKNILEHISLMAQEQVQLEFSRTSATNAAMQQQAQINPQATTTDARDDSKIEARKAVLIAEMTEEFMKEEKELHHNLILILY